MSDRMRSATAMLEAMGSPGVSPDTVRNATATASGRRRKRLVGLFFRTAFILAFGLGALWASLPAESGYSGIGNLPPADLLRVGMGIVVCIGAIIQAFILPKDEGAYTTWTRIGIACVATLGTVLLIRTALKL
jgi:hypothetical protein